MRQTSNKISKMSIENITAISVIKNLTVKMILRNTTKKSMSRIGIVMIVVLKQTQSMS